MPTPVRNQPDLADIVALARAFERDEQRSSRELRERESRLARELPPGNEDRVTIALAWLDLVGREDETVRSIHQRAETAIRLTGLFVATVAILLGWAATLAAFYFDGSGRVNAVAVLAVLAGLPALMLVPFVFAALPTHLARKVPGAGALAGMARGFSPGRLAPWLWRIFPHDLREAVALISNRAGAHQPLYSSVQKWALLRWSQLFALCFQVTALVAALLLVVFTDLAFGWSTTLTTGDAARDAERVHRITSFVATPWSWFVPDAQPSLALIQQSRYFRVVSERVSPAQAAQLGGWWQFVVLTIAIYGVLPRVLTLAVAHARLLAAARGAVIAGPGLSAVLRRLHRARIETAAIEPESATQNESPLESPGRIFHRAAGNVRTVINWSAVPLAPGVLAAAFPDAQLLAAGGAASVEQDAALIRRLGAADGSGDVLVLVKGWEPPLMEILDFLNALRANLSGESAEIVVLPVGLDPDHGMIAAPPAHFKLWRDKLATIRDPSLRVAANRGEVAA